MAIGERIRYFRKKRGLTQKELGSLVGYPEPSADVRIAQYENGSRRPKSEMVEELAETFEVSPKALTVPDIDTNIGLMHTLFALEDRYGLRAEYAMGEPFLTVNKAVSMKAADLHNALLDWAKQAQRFHSGKISKEQYDQWRYNFPRPIELRRAKPVKVKCVILKNK